MTTIEDLKCYARGGGYRSMTEPLAQFLVNCINTKTITPKLKEFMEFHFCIYFEYVEGYGWAVYKDKPFNNMYFSNKNGLVLTEINWDEIFWDFVSIMGNCCDDGYYSVVAIDGVLRLTSDGSDNIMQNNTLAFICHCLDIPFITEIHKYELNWRFIEKYTVPNLIDAFQELNNQEFEQERWDLAFNNGIRYGIITIPIEYDT